MDTLRQDLVYALRTLGRRPGFSALVVVTLALGIGATTAIFSVVYGVLLRPLPYHDSSRLTMVHQTMAKWSLDNAPVSYPNYADWRDRSTSFEELAAYNSYQPMTLTGRGAPERLRGARLTHNAFRLLGVTPQLGRTFSEQEDRTGSERVVVLSHELWSRLFGSDPGAVGQTVTFGAESYQVIGVMPAEFAFPGRSVEFWLPLQGDALSRDRHFLRVVGRFREGVSPEVAQAELDAVTAALVQEHPGVNEGVGARLVPRLEYEVGESRRVLRMLLAAVGMMLLIAWTNTVNLLLSRSFGRGREMALRTALGAFRGRLVRQLLTESAFLAVAGGILGVGIAFGAFRAFLALGPLDLPRRHELGLDADALIFTLVLTILSGVVCGMVPAFRGTGAALRGALGEGGQSLTAGRSRHRLQQTLVVSQLALACTLLVGAGLLSRSFLRLTSVEPGFDVNVLTAQLTLPESRYPGSLERLAFFDELTERLSSVPGLESAGTTSALPMTDSSATGRITVDGRVTAPGEEPVVQRTLVSGDLFRTLGVPLVQGRHLGPSDTDGAPMVTVVNQTMAEKLWPGESPVGRSITTGSVDDPGRRYEIIGVVGDMKQASLEEATKPEMYEAYAQASWTPPSMSVVLHGTGPAAGLTPILRREVVALDPVLPLIRADTMGVLLTESVRSQRFRTLLVGAFALFAGLLAVVGIYGVMAFAVGQRAREIGIRMALGASHRAVVQQVLRQGLVLTGIGLLVGLPAAWAATRLLSALLFNLSARDPWTYVGVALLLAILAVAASLAPARRAGRVDPLAALRCD